MDIRASPFQHRLRRLLAQEFAARGYYLDVESFYDRIPLQSLEVADLELLLQVALASREIPLARVRLVALEKSAPQSEVLQRCRATLESESECSVDKVRGWRGLLRKLRLG